MKKLDSKYRIEGYDINKKLLNMNLIANIKQAGLAIWFMDDGNRTNDSCEINCQKFSYEEKEQLSNLLKLNFNITSNITKNTLYIPKYEFNNFKELLKAYILDSLSYKLKPYKGSV